LHPNLGLSSDQAKEYIVQNVQGVFIWVHLVRAEVLKYAGTGCRWKEIFDLLASLPTELEGFYSRILAELETREGRDIGDGRRVFQLVPFTFRPLRLQELGHALAISGEIDAEFPCSDESFEGELIDGIDRRIIHCTGNFLEIKNVNGIRLYGIISWKHFS
jgi:hypothetical protein